MNEITSVQNNFIKNLKKLMKKKERIEQGLYLLEGNHLVLEGLKMTGTIKYLLFTKEFYEKNHYLSELPEAISCYLVSPEVIKQLTNVPTPQGIVGVAHLPKNNQQLNQSKPILMLDNVQDPGNVGTMIRTADAAGFGTVILGAGSVDIYNDKVLRSMQGSHFHIDIVESPLLPMMAIIKTADIPIYGTELNPEAVTYQSVERTPVFSLIMGNEGQGVSPDILKQTTKNIYIPIEGQAESLNVAVAAGILMYGLKP